MGDPGLIKKYRIKLGNQILLLNAPEGFAGRLSGLPEGAAWQDTADPHTTYDIVQLFTRDSGEVAAYFDKAMAALKPEGAFWIAYPKKSSKVETDLTRDEGWQQVYEANLEGVHMFSIDETWSNIRFAPALSEEEKIKAQYKGKEHLWPVYDKLAATIKGFGDDVSFGIRKTYVGLQRGKQFGIIQPTTKTRLDVGLKLPDTAVTDRLQEAGHFGSGQVTHKVAVFSLDDVDRELVGWLKMAYNALG
jgi:predicted transport protein